MFICKLIEKLRIIFSDTISIGNFCVLNNNLQTRSSINHTISELIGLFWFTVHANLRNFGLTFIRSYFRILCLAGFTLPPTHTTYTMSDKNLAFFIDEAKTWCSGVTRWAPVLIRKKNQGFHENNLIRIFPVLLIV